MELTWPGARPGGEAQLAHQRARAAWTAASRAHGGLQAAPADPPAPRSRGPAGCHDRAAGHVISAATVTAQLAPHLDRQHPPSQVPRPERLPPPPRPPLGSPGPLADDSRMAAAAASGSVPAILQELFERGELRGKASGINECHDKSWDNVPDSERCLPPNAGRPEESHRYPPPPAPCPHGQMRSLTRCAQATI